MMILELLDDNELVDGVELSKEELKKRELQKSIVSMAEDEYRFNYKEQGYVMPEGYEDASGRVDRIKREGALTTRYKEEEQLKTEQVISVTLPQHLLFDVTILRCTVLCSTLLYSTLLCSALLYSTLIYLTLLYLTLLYSTLLHKVVMLCNAVSCTVLHQ
jgi:hypothetical protein